MYVKRYVVRRGRRQYVYLRLVEAFRDEQGRVRHRVLHTLGREDQLKASGQLDQLAAAFTRLYPPLACTRREVGPLLLVGHYLDRLGLVALVDRHLPQRGRAQLTHGEVVAALVANRLCAPSPLYDVAGWGSSAAMAEVLDTPGVLLGDDRLGRTLEALAPLAEEVRGAVMQATTPQGIALYVRPHPGDAAELACIGAALDRLRELLPPGLLVCADSVLGHVKNLCAADRARLRSPTPTPQRPTPSASPTSGPARRPAAWPTGASAPSPRPKRPSARSSGAWAGATTRPAPRSTPRSRGSSAPKCAACCTSPPPP